MSNLIHTTDGGSRVNFTTRPNQVLVDALIRHGYRYDERAKQWWQRSQGGAMHTAEAFHAWLETQAVREADEEAHKYRFQSYYTPNEVAQRLVYLAEVEKGMECLEPSAGHGAIAYWLDLEGAKVTCIEADPIGGGSLAGNPAAHRHAAGRFPPHQTAGRAAV